jgi:transcriptional regulator with XRE-family HTH domain
MHTLAQLRFRHFLTQRALADRIGVHPRMVSTWEQGRNRPNMEHLRALCELFKIGPEEIEWPQKPQPELVRNKQA